MDFELIVAQLKQEVSRIDRAISALQPLDGTTARRGRPPKEGEAAQAAIPKRRTMSAAARAKIAAAQRARWAKQKGQTRTKTASAKQSSTAQKKTSRRPTMSAAARKRLSALMKARWAQRKKRA